MAPLPFLLHRGDGGATEMKDGMDMHIKSLLPCFRGQIKQPAVDGFTCGMDQHIHRAQAGFRFVGATSGLIGFAAIGEDNLASSAQCEDCMLRLPSVVVETATDE